MTPPGHGALWQVPARGGSRGSGRSGACAGTGHPPDLFSGGYGGSGTRRFAGQ
jgi:hypothetical protein